MTDIPELDPDTFAVIKMDDGNFIGVDSEETDPHGTITIIVIRLDEESNIRLFKMKLPPHPEQGDVASFVPYNDMVFDNVGEAGEWMREEAKRRMMT